MLELKVKLDTLENKKERKEKEYQQKLESVDHSKLDPMEEIELEEQIRLDIGLTRIEVKISKIKRQMVEELFNKIENSPKVIEKLGEENIETLKEGRYHFKSFNKLLDIAKTLN
jgi:ribosome assembly protein YihI (activator of Der GTPase)